MRVARWITVGAGVAAVIALATAANSQLSPYAGQQSREIKSLSAQDIDDLLNARGWALAKAAELNGYPGPTHTLDMARDLKLTPDQVRAITVIKERMAAAAKPLGSQIVARERELDQQFVQGKITEADLTAETAAIGDLFGHLRAVHLRSHLETKAVLTARQVAQYNELRGYGSDSAPQHERKGNHGG